MPIFTDADLQVFADLGTDSALKDTCEILRDNSNDSDDQGGFENISWPVVETVPCAVIDGKQPEDFVQAGKLKSRSYQTILLPRNTNVLESDRLRVNGAAVYQIEGIKDPTSYEIFRRVAVWREP